jgi:hypothetical protein
MRCSFGVDHSLPTVGEAFQHLTLSFGHDDPPPRFGDLLETDAPREFPFAPRRVFESSS